MIKSSEYFNNKIGDASPEHKANAVELLHRVNNLLDEYQQETGHIMPFNPLTVSQISGSRNGDGGFRLSNSQTGAATSSHKEGKGVDIYDPIGQLDDWITDTVLVRHGLYREHPSKTVHWCHLTTRPPRSGNRTFMP